jgi:predicted dehydrogenase/threonine dehydrogenase-like Zn-dependent dehydrogenase
MIIPIATSYAIQIDSLLRIDARRPRCGISIDEAQSMLQVVQNFRKRELKIESLPEPLVRPGHVLIQNECSVVSAGTEKTIVDTASKSLLAKARHRPDLVRQVLAKVKTIGWRKTYELVSAKLDAPIALGYASSGTVVACGEGVQGFKPGDRVASNGPHAGVVCVPKHLCALVPQNVATEEAAFAVIGAIALQGVRLARLGLGDSVFVIGLGLIGQIAVKLLKAQGCHVLATDLDAAKCQLAVSMGADFASPGLTAEQVQQMTRGYGADAALITAATQSNGPVELAGEAVRSKGRVVAVGAVGLNLPRPPYYNKEVEFVVSCSYGPGRYDAEYEQRGHDYPIGYVRWTEQRNLQAVLDLMSKGKLDVKPLITHRFSIDEAESAYELIKTGSQPYLGIVLAFPQNAEPVRRIDLKPQSLSGPIQIGCIGIGGFARGVLLPALQKVPGAVLRSVTSAGGLSATLNGKSLGFQSVVRGEDELLSDRDINTVFVFTRHNEHAGQVIKSLCAGKHTFVEKPLALTLQELTAVEEALVESGPSSPILTVGFNRRFSPSARNVKKFFASVCTPLMVSIRFNAGPLPSDHWTQDEEVGGGRIIGEACHAIDLATYLIGSPVTRVFAESVGGCSAPSITDDQCFITMRHANGGVSNVHYVSSGDKDFAKERVEVFGGGRVAVIDDFRDVVLSAGGKRTTTKGAQDKGHQAEVAAFAEAIRDGGAWPISWEELRSTSLAAILAVRSLREGMPIMLFEPCEELQNPQDGLSVCDAA